MAEVNKYASAIDTERVRLGWSAVKSAQLLNQHFGKRSRWLLTDDELVAALDLFKSIDHCPKENP
jgi:hypothetical protein